VKSLHDFFASSLSILQHEKHAYEIFSAAGVFSYSHNPCLHFRLAFYKCFHYSSFHSLISSGHLSLHIGTAC